MKRSLLCGFSLSLFCAFSNGAAAQVTSDGTTATTVSPTVNGVSIDNGDRAGSNLFHSFTEFSVPNGTEAFFNNANDITNIFSRVTGGNISNIDGLLRANGTANLFLINPAGIVFGEGAQLQLGGSFYGSTADSIVFGNGEFSATDLATPPLITINAPIGLNFRDNPGAIETQGSQIGGIPGDFALIGGLVNLDGGNINARSIHLGGLTESGSIDIDQANNFIYPENVAKADVFIQNGVFLGIFGTTGGEISINANNLTQDGSNAFVGRGNAITIQADNDVLFDNRSFLISLVEDNENQGDAGDVTIRATNVTLDRGSEVLADINGTGNAGNIDIVATNAINLTNISKLQTQVRGEGDAGNITLLANSVFMNDDSKIIADTRGIGDSGDISITVIEDFLLDRGSFIAAGVEQNGVGAGANININAASLTIRNRASLSSNTKAEGNAGGINITTNALELDNFARVQVSTNPGAIGSGGRITVDADNVKITRESVIDSFTNNDFAGGEIVISADNLELASGGTIFTGANSLGDAGGIQLNITESLIADGSNIPTEFPEIESIGDPIFPFFDNVLDNVQGRTGLLANTSAESQGNGGNITIGVFQQTGDNFVLEPNDFSDRVNFANGVTVTADSQGTGRGGTITIKAEDLTLDNGTISAITTVQQPEPDLSSEINLEVPNRINLRNNSTISAQALNQANGGTITINTDFIVANPNENSDIIASAVEGNGGTIDITAESLLGIEKRDLNPQTNDINASSNVEGLDGTVSIETPDGNSLRETPELSNDVVSPEVVAARNACTAADVEDDSSLVVRGKGGVPPQVTEPLGEDLILDPDSITNFVVQNSEANNNEPTVAMQPITYDADEPIYLARGIQQDEDGTIILTAHPTTTTQNRAVGFSPNCDQ